MKTIVFFTSLFLILSSFVIKTKEELFLRNVADNIKNAQLSNYQKLWINEPEFNTVISNAAVPEPEKKKLKSKMVQSYLDASAKKDFEQLQKQAKKLNITLTALKIDSLWHKEIHLNGIEEMRFKIYLNDTKKRFVLSGEKVLKVPIGWKLSSPLQLTESKP